MFRTKFRITAIFAGKIEKRALTDGVKILIKETSKLLRSFPKKDEKCEFEFV